MRVDRQPARFLPGLGGLLRGEFTRWSGWRILLHTAVWTLLVSGTLWYVTTNVRDARDEASICLFTSGGWCFLSDPSRSPRTP
jgi:hypothetical protein